MKNVINDSIKEQAVNALKKLIAQPSYLQSSEKGAPFGKGIRLALDDMMKICDNLGFKTYEDPDGYYGYAEIGNGSEIFGIIGHLDTVPVGDKSSWKYDPFTPKIINNIIYGRGTQDDKGPTIAVLFAVKALLNANYKLNKRIRFIFGTDEETLWRGIAKYNEKEEAITCGFAPDAEFPLIYAEKGLQQSYLIGPGTDKFELKMNNAFNAVPDKASYNGPKLDEVKSALKRHQYHFIETNNGITVTGKAVHAMNAPEGINAVLRLGIALNEVFNFKPLDFIGKVFKEDATGSNVLGVVEDESGQLTINISSIEINSKETKIQIDLRIPVTIDHDKLIDKLSQKIAPYDLTYKHFDYLAPLFVPKDSKLVQTLMNVYKTQTGDTTAKPQISGGATFARTMHDCVAFGGMLPGTPDYMHQVNEQWELSKMYKAMEIYAEAVKQICFE